MTNLPFPALRIDLDIFPIEHEKQTFIVLHDRDGITNRSIAISPAAMLIAGLLDGQRAIADIRTAFASQTGISLQDQEIEKLVKQLADMNFLETPELQAKRRAVDEAFRASPARAAVHQGGGYPENTLELATFMDNFFQDPKGPGKQKPDNPSQTTTPVGLISPHIDLHRGGPAYAWAYGTLADYPPPDVIVALGVAHQSPNSPWVLTSKTYETAYGPITVDQPLYQEIQKGLWYDGRNDEVVHRREHSLEFQALWLKYLWREKTPAWVPILCSNFDRFCADRAPSTNPELEKTLQGIGNVLCRQAQNGRRILVLAGVDLAHVGPRFGDAISLGPETEKRIENEDHQSLTHVWALEADAFYLSVVANGHWRKYCGLSALYTALRWIKMLKGAKTAPGRPLTYGQAPDPAGGIVSFSSGIFL